MTTRLARRAVAALGATTLGAAALVIASPAQAGPDSYTIAAAGTFSIPSFQVTGDILGGKIENGSGQVDVSVAGHELPLDITNAVVSATDFQATLAAMGESASVNFPGSGYVYSGKASLGSITAEITGLTLQPVTPPVPPHPYGPKENQTRGNCPAVPTKVKKNGTTRILPKGCKTNAGQSVSVAVKCQRGLRGDVKGRRLCKLIRNKNGSVYLRTFGAKRWTLHIKESAPATTDYTSYYDVEKVRFK